MPIDLRDLLSNRWIDGTAILIIVAALERWLKIGRRAEAAVKWLLAKERLSWSKWYLREGVYVENQMRRREDGEPVWLTYWVSLVRSYFADTTVPHQNPSGQFRIHLKLFNATPADAIYTLLECPVEVEGWNGSKYVALGTSKFIPPQGPQVAPAWSAKTEAIGRVDAPGAAAALAASGAPVRFKFTLPASVAPPSTTFRAPLTEKFLIEAHLGDEPK